MSALHYEYLIRRAHQKDRYGAQGADADIFRSLLRDNWEYQSATTPENKKKFENTYHKNADEVKTYIKDAIAHVLKKHSFNQAQQDTLQTCLNDLNTYDIDDIKNVIARADGTILAIGLYPQ